MRSSPSVGYLLRRKFGGKRLIIGRQCNVGIEAEVVFCDGLVAEDARRERCIEQLFISWNRRFLSDGIVGAEPFGRGKRDVVVVEFIDGARAFDDAIVWRIATGE